MGSPRQLDLDLETRDLWQLAQVEAKLGAADPTSQLRSFRQTISGVGTPLGAAAVIRSCSWVCTVLEEDLLRCVDARGPLFEGQC